MDMGTPCLERGVETIPQGGTPEISAGGSIRGCQLRKDTDD